MLCLDAYLLLDPRPCDKAVLPQPMAALLHISIMADVVLIAETREMSGYGCRTGAEKSV